MVDPADKARLERLDKRIAELKGKDAPRHTEAEEHHSQVQAGWRMVIELVAGVGIGCGMGYGLDVLFGTLPVFLVVMTLLGFAAGVRTMLRTAEELQRENAELEAGKKDAGPAPGKDDAGGSPDRNED